VKRFQASQCARDHRVIIAVAGDQERHDLGADVGHVDRDDRKQIMRRRPQPREDSSKRARTGHRVRHLFVLKLPEPTGSARRQPHWVSGAGQALRHTQPQRHAVKEQGRLVTSHP
jgi:hypothetical protein